MNPEDKRKAKEYEKTLEDKKGEVLSVRSKEKIFDILMDNIMKEDFKMTRRAGYIMFFLPCAINVYFLFANRGRYLKNMLSFSTLFGGYFYLNFRMRNEIDMFIRKDDVSRNIIRYESNKMHANNYSAPDYIEESEEIIGEIFILINILIRHQKKIF